MDPRIKGEWLRALRSDEYRQGTGTLRYGNEFCCLGVLCDVYAKETKVDWEGDYAGRDDYTFMGCGSALPEEVMEWAGLDHEFGWEGLRMDMPLQNRYNLADLNDGGKTFKEIAEVIEREL